MIIVIDNNIFISGLIKKGASSEIFDLFLKQEFTLFISIPILHELATTLIKPKFNKLIPDTDKITLLKLLKQRSTLVMPSRKFKACRDPKDNKVLDCAFAAKADFIITGDKDLLVLSPFHKIPITTPNEFLKILKKKS